MENKQVKKVINGKEITIEVIENNQPNINLMINGIIEATKVIKGC